MTKAWFSYVIVPRGDWKGRYFATLHTGASGIFVEISEVAHSRSIFLSVVPEPVALAPHSDLKQDAVVLATCAR